MVDMTFLYTTVVTAFHIFTFMFFDEWSSHVHVCNALLSLAMSKQEFTFHFNINFLCSMFRLTSQADTGNYLGMYLEKNYIEEAYKVKMTNEQWEDFKYKLKVAERNCGDELFGSLIPDTIADLNLQKLESSGSEEEEEEEKEEAKKEEEPLKA